MLLLPDDDGDSDVGILMTRRRWMLITKECQSKRWIIMTMVVIMDDDDDDDLVALVLVVVKRKLREGEGQTDDGNNENVDVR